jgi:hypothetical protein
MVIRIIALRLYFLSFERMFSFYNHFGNSLGFRRVPLVILLERQFQKYWFEVVEPICPNFFRFATCVQ